LGWVAVITNDEAGIIAESDFNNNSSIKREVKFVGVGRKKSGGGELEGDVCGLVFHVNRKIVIPPGEVNIREIAVWMEEECPGIAIHRRDDCDNENGLNKFNLLDWVVFTFNHNGKNLI
jgi:hypothetical protein